MKVRPKDEPNMSDSTLLISVEDLINMAMGPTEKNAVNFKMIQTILHILARQLRMLERRVEIRITETSPPRQKEKKEKKKEFSTDSSSSKEVLGKSPRPDSARGHVKGIKEQLDKKKKGGHKEEKAETMDKEINEKDSMEKDHKEKEDKKDKKGRKTGKTEEKEKERDDTTEQKEKDKSGKTKKEKADKEKGKTGKEKEIAEIQKKEEKEVWKEKERSGGGKEKRGKEKTKAPSGTSIAISEVERQKEKILVVEKGPTTISDTRTRVGSIEVVTQSQFALLEEAVKELKQKAGPLPPLALPDNEKLRADIARGSASLTDTMQAMQVNARVQAAEEVINRMTGLLTQLAAAGALPGDAVSKVTEVKFTMPDEEVETVGRTATPAKSHTSTPSRKSVAIDPMLKPSQASRLESDRLSVAPRLSMASRPSIAGGRPSLASRPSISSGVLSPGVTHKEMDDALRSLREDLMKSMNNMTTKATTAAETAVGTAKAVAEKLDVALKLNSRLNSLYSLVNDYSEQLSGFDAGLTTQMQGFQEKMVQMRADLKTGLVQLEQVNNNAETAAVLELTERYEGLVSELDHTLHAHQALTNFQSQLGDELRGLVECVEMLREQKADRDEVLDGLRDKLNTLKADNSRLDGLLSEAEFTAVKIELERRLELCYDKFHKQDQVWMGAMKDLSKLIENKAEIMQLLAVRDDAQLQLRELNEKLRQLAIILGEPKAAILTRHLSRDATCGACLTPALMEAQDITYGSPPALPALRPAPTGAEDEPCTTDWMPEPTDERKHICHRWCGGSHTLLSEAVTREQATPLAIQTPPTKRYAGYGTDGRLYMLEEELQPCMECNALKLENNPKDTSDVPPIATVDGAGDQVFPALK